MAGTAFRTSQGRLRLGWRLLLFLLAAAVVTLAAGMLLPASMTGGSAALLIGALVAGWLLLAEDGRRPAALGFHLGRSAWGESVRGLGLGVAASAVAVLGMAALGGARWTEDAGTALGWLLGAGGALLFFALPAAAEEALLRGYPLQALAEVWGPGPALAATSVLFGLLHLGNPGVTPLAAANVALAGLWLGVVYMRTGSLWWATGAHLGWNWTGAYAADMPVSGLELFDAPLYDSVAAGPVWLGGGAFGPEGSVLATVALSGAAWVAWRARWLERSAMVVAAEPLALMERPGGRDSTT